MFVRVYIHFIIQTYYDEIATFEQKIQLTERTYC